jgi:hypothetical protein
MVFNCHCEAILWPKQSHLKSMRLPRRKDSSMRKTGIVPLFLVFLFPVLLNARYYGEVESGFQVNHPTSSSVGAAFARLRLAADLSTPHTNINFHLRLAAASGKAYFGSTSLMAPANDVAVHTKELSLDEAFFSFGKKWFGCWIGLIDPTGYASGNSGFFNKSILYDQSRQFFSTHFLRLLANNGLDQFLSSSQPSLFVSFRISPRILFRTGMTFGLASRHLFLRNSIPVELEWSSPSLRVSLNAGFGDAHSSYTHKISPSWGVILEKSVLRHLFVFGRYSRVEKDLKTYRTPARSFSGSYLVAMEFSPFQEHAAAGLAFQTEETGLGAGISQLKEFDRGKRESVIEVFARKKIFGIIDITPDFQYVLNPDGELETKYMWIAGLRLLYRFSL